MKFFVNDRCIGCGLCTNTCPEVFDMKDDGVAAAVHAPEGNEEITRAREAQQNCPVDAIETK